MKRLDIAIAGAGMGGLTAAIALQQHGHRVRIFDRVRTLAPVGAAISVWSNGVKVLDRLGLGPAIDAASGDMQSMSYATHEGQPLTQFSLAPLYQAVGRAAKPIARSELQRILLEGAGAEHVTLEATCERYSQSEDAVTLHFADGTSTTADMLIAADGTHSRLRQQVMQRPIERQYCGYVNWNGRVTANDDLAPAHEWKQFVGDGKRVSLMPMGNGCFYFFLDVPLPAGTSNDPANYRSELADHFAGWAAPVQRLIERLDPTTMARVEIHDIERLDPLVDKRVALIGDAAHATAPDLGQGGCQAMEDGWVLSECLQACNGDVEKALLAYNDARVDRVAELVSRARKRCDITHGKDPAATLAWYQELASEDGSNIMGGMQKTIDGGPLA